MLSLNLNLEKAKTYKFVYDKQKFIEELIYICLDKYTQDELNGNVFDINDYDFFLTKNEFDIISNKIEIKLNDKVYTKQQEIESLNFEKLQDEAPALFSFDKNNKDKLKIINSFFIFELLKNISNYNLVDTTIELENKLESINYQLIKKIELNDEKFTFLELIENSSFLYNKYEYEFIESFRNIYFNNIKDSLLSVKELILKEIVNYLNTKKNLIENLKKDTQSSIKNKKNLLKKIEILLNKTNKIIKDKKRNDSYNLFIIFRTVKKQLEILEKENIITENKHNINLINEINILKNSIAQIGEILNLEIVSYIKNLLELVKKEQQKLGDIEELNNFYLNKLVPYEGRQINNNKEEIKNINNINLIDFFNIIPFYISNDKMPNKNLSIHELDNSFLIYQEKFSNKYNKKETITFLSEESKNKSIAKKEIENAKLEEYNKFFDVMFIEYKKINNTFSNKKVHDFLFTNEIQNKKLIDFFNTIKDIQEIELNNKNGIIWIVRQELFLREKFIDLNFKNQAKIARIIEKETTTKEQIQNIDKKQINKIEIGLNNE